MTIRTRARWLAAALLVGVAQAAAADERFTLEITPTVVGASEVRVIINSNLPGSVEVMLDLALAGQAPDSVFIGTNKRVPLADGRADTVIGKDDLPAGDYDVEASFYPTWGPQDATAKAANLRSEIHASKRVTLRGTGEPATIAERRLLDGRWVMQNVSMGMPWDKAYWVKRFGKPEPVPVTRYNPAIIKAYYFKSLDMTLIVNELKREIDTWRLGRQSY